MSEYENISNKITQANGMCRFGVNSIETNGVNIKQKEIGFTNTKSPLLTFKDVNKLNGSTLDDLEKNCDALVDKKTVLNGHVKPKVICNGSLSSNHHEPPSLATELNRPSNFNTPFFTVRSADSNLCQRFSSNSSTSPSTTSLTTTATTTASLTSSIQSRYDCQWRECHYKGCKTSLDLANHVKEQHITPMIDNGFFVCLWQNCKVYNRPSSSHNWLLKHIHVHTGNRPFSCVIDGCKMTFATQNGLARHVPSHFKLGKNKRGYVDDVISNQADSPQSLCNGSPVAEKRPRSSRYLQNRKSIVSRQLSRKDDGFDHKAMDAIKQRLTQHEFSQSMTSNGLTVKLNAKPIGRRLMANGKQDILVNWKPSYLLPDTWISLTQYEKSQKPFLHPSKDIPSDSNHELYSKFYQRFSHHRSRKRK